MTALNAKDGDSGNYSFLDLVSYIKSTCDDVNKNLEELYKRVVFTYLINNTDNHLRNHGLLYDGYKLVLSPMFDINPSFEISQFGLPLSEKETNRSTIILEGKYYGLDETKATSIYDHIYKVIKDNYQRIAEKYNTRNKEIELFSQIFESKN